MTQTKCPRCGHEWDYKGNAWWITCPRCRKMIKNPEIEELRKNDN